MSAARRVLATLGLGVALTLASSVVKRTRLEVQDWDCPPAPASCARPMVVAGYPFAYIVDYHGKSVVNRADLMGALMGEDIFHADAFAWNVIAYGCAAAAAWWGVRRPRRRRRAGA